MAFSTILPAPGDLINSSGIADPAGLPAPGFSGLNFKSNYSVALSRSRSARGQPKSNGEHYWSFDIEYHPMTENSFRSLESFLYGHDTRLKPFYVFIPNVKAQPTSFYDYANGNSLQVVSDNYAGDRTIVVNSTNTTLLPGCFINLNDSLDALHKSTYKVARVETPTLYEGNPPDAGTIRLTIFPPLQRDLIGIVTVNFTKPLFRVLQKNNIEPDYDTENLISISLNVEELLP